MIQICVVCGKVGNMGDADWKEREGNRYCPVHDEESFQEKDGDNMNKTISPDISDEISRAPHEPNGEMKI